LDAEKWVDVYKQQMTLPFQFDQSKMTRMQQLMERVGRGDQAATAEFEKLQKEMDDISKAAGDAVEKAVIKAPIFSSAFARDARWIVVRKKGERISQLVVVFPIPSLHRTAIEHVWDLSDYPSAWPQAER